MNGNIVNAYNLTQQSPKSLCKVAILGAESTGKTTLCRDLATHFGSLWVPEYMREFLQHKWDNERKTCTWNDLLPIAQGQIILENRLAQQAVDTKSSHHSFQNSQNGDAQKYLFCDTSLFELMAYAHWYYADCPQALMQAALAHHYDWVLLTEVDTPWVADDLRDSPHQRDDINAFFAQQLACHHKPFKRIGGTRQNRVWQVIDILHTVT